MKWMPTLPWPMASKWKELCRLCLISFLAAARASWSLITDDVGPSPRSVHAGAWDSDEQRFWVHAGAGEQVMQDLWLFDATTTVWTPTSYTSLSNVPAERKDHVAVWDPTTSAFWIHGGYDGTNFIKDLWRFHQNRWTRIASNSVAGPCARSEHVGVWDSDQSVLWIHGGYDGTLKADLWKYDSEWLLIPTLEMPTGRAQHVACTIKLDVLWCFVLLFDMIVHQFNSRRCHVDSWIHFLFGIARWTGGYLGCYPRGDLASRRIWWTRRRSHGHGLWLVFYNDSMILQSFYILYHFLLAQMLPPLHFRGQCCTLLLPVWMVFRVSRGHT